MQREIAYLIVVLGIIVIVKLIDLWKDLSKTEKDRKREKTYNNWHNHYNEQERIRQKEIAEDPYYNLDADDKLLSRQIRVEHSEPTFEEWKAAREAEQDKDQSTT